MLSKKFFAFGFLVLPFVGACSKTLDDSGNSSTATKTPVAQSEVKPNTLVHIEDDSMNVIAGKAPSGDVKKSTVALDLDGVLCSGTILSSKYVLTASHCVEDYSESANWNVVFGGSAEALNQRTIVSVINDNAPFTFDKPDIAIVEFSGGLPSGYGAASLPALDQRLPLGKSVTVAGFGVSRIKPERYGKLLEGQMTLDKVLKDGTLKLKRIGKSPVNLCFGDSGGPTYLTTKNKLVVIGITSYGLDNKCVTPTFVTDVRKFLGWIDAKVGLENLGAP